MKYLYDADATIDYLEDASGARDALQTFLPSGMAISSVTLIELYTGVFASPNPALAEQQLKTLLRVMTTLGLTRHVIRQAAWLRYDLVTRKLSFRRRAYDLIVAATALAYDLTVVTSNTDDYRAFRGLATIDPRTGKSEVH